VMARGWESKSVEEQQSAADAQLQSKQRLRPEQAARKQQEETIHLSAVSSFSNSSRCRNPRHRQMLESALADLTPVWHAWSRSMVCLSLRASDV